MRPSLGSHGIDTKGIREGPKPKARIENMLDAAKGVQFQMDTLRKLREACVEGCVKQGMWIR